MRWLTLIGILVSTAAWAGPAEDAALAATEVRDEWCSDMAQRTTTMTGALAAVAPVLDQVSKTYDESKEPYLLYWRGVLLECTNQETRSVDDLTTFAADAANRKNLPDLVRDAERRLRRLSFGGGGGVIVSDGDDPTAIIAVGGGYELMADADSPHHYGGVSLTGSFRLTGPLRLVGFGRFMVGSPHVGTTEPQRSALVPFGIGLQGRFGGDVAFRIGGLATFAVNQVESLGPPFTAGATAVIGGAFRLGETPLELRPELEVGFLGPFFHFTGGVAVAARIP